MTTTANATMNQTTLTPTRTARDLLRGRMLTVINCDSGLDLAPWMDGDLDGLVLTGESRHSVMRYLRNGNPDLVVMAETNSHTSHFATATDPFYLPGDDNGLLPAPTLTDVVENQRNANAAIVILPAGYIQAGDRRALRAVIDTANTLAGYDILVPLYLDKAWLAEKYMDQLTAAVDMSLHPIAFAFGSQKNPLDSSRKLALHAKLLSYGQGSVSWRTDLAGLAALARGALAAAIGALPSQRRVTSPDDSGKARNPADRTPNTLIPGLMHYMKAGAMRDERYVAAPAPACFCRECAGQRIDRFTTSKEDHRAAEHHNLEILREMTRDLVALPASQRPAAWRAKAKAAVLGHAETAAATMLPFSAGDQVEAWAEN